MNDGEYRTSDFYLSATLLTLGTEVVGLDRTNPARVVFRFRDHDDRRQWVRDYFAGNLRVNPAQFAAAIKALKAELYAGRR